MQPGDQLVALGDALGEILGEVAHVGIVAPLHLTPVQLQVQLGDLGRIGQQGVEERGLADAVAAQESDLLAALHHGREALDDLLTAALAGLVRVVALLDTLELQGVAAPRLGLVELDEGALDVAACQVAGLEAFHFLAAAVHLAAAGARGEALDELVQLVDLLFALGVVGLDTAAHLDLGHDHVVVATRVLDDRLVVDVGDVSADVVQEVAIVGDHHHGALVPDEELLQPVDGVEIQVVGGLVQQQAAGVAEEGLGEQHADLLAALQLAHLAVMQFLGDTQAGQQHGRIALGGVAILVGHDALQFGHPHAVLVGHLRLVVDGVPLLQGLPEACIAHDHRVDDPEFVEGELVLAQDAHFAGADHIAHLLLELAREDLHERGLARAVGSRETVASPRIESRGHILEQDLRAVTHGDILYSKHGISRTVYSTLVFGGFRGVFS